MDARKASFVTGAGLVGVGVLAARSLGPKLHEHCKTMQAEKCQPKACCVGRMNAEEVK